MEANARRQGCRGAIHRARLPTYCTLGNLRELLPRAMAAGPFAESTAAAGEKSGLGNQSTLFDPADECLAAVLFEPRGARSG